MKEIFPQKYIYLDCNASGFPLPAVCNMVQNFIVHPLNPSSTHYLGQVANGLVEDTREFLLDYTNCDSSHKCIFLSCGSEANNFAINNIEGNFDLYICTAGEHKSVILPISAKTNHLIAQIDKNSLIDEDNLLSILSQNQDKKIFLSIIYANNETGAINDLKNLIDKIRKIHKNIIIHSDIAQAIGKINIDITALDLDLATIVGYKFGGIVGGAALLHRKKIKFQPMIFGGSQESNLRAGTENVLAIYAMKIALENQPNYQNIQILRDNFEKNLIDLCGNDAKIFAHDVDRIPNTSYFAVSNLPSKTQLIAYSNAKIYLGSGSACSAGLDEDSHVLKAMNCNEQERKDAIRMSLGWQNNIEEINIFVNGLKELYNKFK